MVPNFTIRIYGIYIKNGKLLLSREKYGEREMLKFPGGGLEFGEGTRDCLKREMQEEFKLDVEILDHLYTTDFFVSSAFHKNTQVMSIYYWINILSDHIPIGEVFKEEHGEQSLTWEPMKTFMPAILTFPIDQHVGRLISEHK